MSATNLDASDLNLANLGGVINESVLQAIFDISNVELPYTQRAAVGSHDNQNHTWRMDKLAAPEIDGQLVDGQEVATGTANATKVGRRVGNHSEIRGLRVEVSTRAQKVDTIGYANEHAYQISRRNIELRRNVEATLLSNNASVIGTDAVAGQSAGLAAWLTTTDVDGNALATNNVILGALGVVGGWDVVDTDSLVAAAVPGTAAALTETNVRIVSESIYDQGGEARVAMMTPKVKTLFSAFLFTDAARIATQVNQEPGGSARERKAQGSVDLYISDFSALQLVPNRMQPIAGAVAESNLFILDFSMLEVSFLQGYNVMPLAKTDLSNNSFISVDYTHVVKNWDSCGYVGDIDESTAMVA